MRSVCSRIARYEIFTIMILISLTVSAIVMLCGCARNNGDLRSSAFSGPLEGSRIIELSVESACMGRKMPCRVYLPKGYGGGKEYPVWYGLHGYSSNESMWIENGGVAEAADELTDSGEIEPIIMVFPYTRDATMKEISKDLEDGKIDERNMDRFLCQELVPYIDSHYYTVTKAEGRYIGGFSMGGMIALRIAFHHTGMFSKVGGYSAAVLSDDYSGKQLEEWLYPDEKVNDISDFDRKKGLDKLDVYLDAGKTNDPFSAGLQSLYGALQKRGIRSEFHLYDGGHTLRADSVKDYLRFYAAKE